MFGLICVMRAHTSRPTTSALHFGEASRFGPAPFTSFHFRVLHLLECIALVITVMVVILLLSLLLLSLLCCCLLRTLVSSRLFPFLVVSLYLRLSHVSCSLCTRTILSSSLASPPAPPPLPLIVSRSLFALRGRKSPRDTFPDTPSSSGDLYARPAKDRSKVDQSIASVASIHLDPRITEGP